MARPSTRLRELRIEAGLTMEQLAVHAGLTRLTISRVEAADEEGLGNIGLATLRSIADYFNISVVDLIPSLAQKPKRKGAA